jgi:localization factor PodJL
MATMMPGNPWHLQGIEPVTKARAEESARRVGLSVEQWLNDLIYRSGSENQPYQPQPAQYAPYPVHGFQPPYAHMPPPQAAPAGLDHGSNGDNINSLNSSIESLASQIEILTRQNMATSIPAPQPAPASSSNAGESRAKVDKTLRSIVDLIETSNTQTNKALGILESRMNGAADNVAPVAQAANPVPPIARHEPAPHKPPLPDEQPTRFMARKERRRQRLAGLADNPGIAAPQVNAPEPPIATPPAPNPDMESLLDLAKSLQDSLNNPQPDTGVTDLRDDIRILADRMPDAGVTDLRDDIRMLADRMPDAGQPSPVDEKLVTLQSQIDRIARQFDSTSDGLASLGDLDRKVSSLFDRLEQTRQIIQESSRVTALEAAEQVGREATRAAVEAAAELVAQQLPRSVAGNEAEIVKGLDGKIQDLRADISLTDDRSLHMFDQVQVSLKAIQKQLDEQPGIPVVPSVQTQSAAQMDASADQINDAPLSNGQMADAQAPAEHSDEPMVAPPVVVAPEVDARPGGEAVSTAPEPVQPVDTNASRPRAPGSGHPHLAVPPIPAVNAKKKGSTAKKSDPVTRDAPLVPPSQVAAPVVSPATGQQSLKTASTNEELLAAARRAARAASSAAPQAEGGPKRSGLRGRIAERTSSFRRQRAAAKDNAQTANATTGEATQAGSDRSAARKPIVLAAAAILLFVGSVQVYDMLNKGRNQVPTGPQATTTSLENLDQASPGTAPADQPILQLDGPGEQPSSVRVIQPAGRESLLQDDNNDVTGSLPAANGVMASAIGGMGSAPGTAQSFLGNPAQDAVPGMPEVEIEAASPDASSPINMADVPPTGSTPTTLQAAAANGDPAAQYEIASRLAEGRGTAPDPAAALSWYQMAAAQGLAPAQYRLGSMYEKGLGVAADRDTAQTWYLRAAEQGNRKAMHNLAVIYADGVSGEPDLESAAQWFRKAADYGLNDSQFNLGILYARGMGVPPNMAEAYKWLEIAAANGDADAGVRRDAIASELDEQSLVAARLAAQTWQPTPMVQTANAVALPADGWDSSEVETREVALPGPDIIRNVQNLLTSIGHNPGPADGIWGPNTRRAITEFQIQNQITATGRLTPDLLRKLQQASG